MDHRIFEGVFHGLFGGLFGPVIAQWLRRFKYWVIFFVAMVGTHICFFLVGSYARGFSFAIQAVSEYTFTPVGILFPIGVGTFAVIVAFLGALNSKGRNEKIDSK